jgi:hypothetical protein
MVCMTKEPEASRSGVPAVSRLDEDDGWAVTCGAAGMVPRRGQLVGQEGWR